MLFCTLCSEASRQHALLAADALRQESCEVCTLKSLHPNVSLTTSMLTACLEEQTRVALVHTHPRQQGIQPHFELRQVAKVEGQRQPALRIPGRESAAIPRDCSVGMAPTVAGHLQRSSRRKRPRRSAGAAQKRHDPRLQDPQALYQVARAKPQCSRGKIRNIFEKLHVRYWIGGWNRLPAHFLYFRFANGAIWLLR